MQIIETQFEELTPLLNKLLTDHARLEAGKPSLTSKKLAFSLTEGNQVLGGITGTLRGKNLHINTLVLEKNTRGRGNGHKLMKALEQKAGQEGATILTVCTQDFQALEFYQKLGYAVFGELKDCPFEGTTKYYLYKHLQPRLV